MEFLCIRSEFKFLIDQFGVVLLYRRHGRRPNSKNRDYVLDFQWNRSLLFADGWCLIEEEDCGVRLYLEQVEFARFDDPLWYCSGRKYPIDATEEQGPTDCAISIKLVD